MSSDPHPGDHHSPAGAPQDPPAAPPQAPQYGSAPQQQPGLHPQPGYPQQSAHPQQNGQPQQYGQAVPGQPQYGQPAQGQYGRSQGQPQPGQPAPGQPQYDAGAAGSTAPGASAPKNPYFDFTGYQTRMPTAWPRSVRDASPSFRGGLGGIFQTAHMPMDARIGYWIWLVGCVSAIVAWFFAMATILIGILFNPIILMATGMMSLFGDIRWGVILFYVATMILQLIMLVLQLALTLKIREGAEWARMGLAFLTLVGIVYSIILTAIGVESGGAGTVVVNLLSLALVAIFWLPQSNAWFLRTTAEAEGGTGRSARH